LVEAQRKIEVDHSNLSRKILSMCEGGLLNQVRRQDLVGIGVERFDAVKKGGRRTEESVNSWTFSNE